MSTARICLSIVLCGLAAAQAASAQGGLRMDDQVQSRQSTWPQWQARFGATISVSPLDGGNRWQLSAGQLLGDYYWSGLRPAGFGRAGGFRATSGLLLGQRSAALGTPALSALQGGSLTLLHATRVTVLGGESQNEAWAAVPYIGVGYSAVSLRGGWGFTADLGLAGTPDGLRARRDAIGGPSADEILRNLRLTPVLQIGASYAF